MDSGLRVAIPGHFDPTGQWCRQRRGIPLTPTSVLCTCCEAQVILHKPIASHPPTSTPSTDFLVVA